MAGHANRRHGESKSYLHMLWIRMRRRCRDPHYTGYKNWGGRGIRVCPEWQLSYEAFRDYLLTTLGPIIPASRRSPC